MVGTGTTLAYAKCEPRFRESLKARSEIMDNVIKIIWQEDQTYLQYLKQLIGHNRTDTEVEPED